MKIRFSTDELGRFADWSGDRNPLHVDPDLARQMHFGRPVVHGALAVIQTLNSLGSRSGAAVRGLDVEFRGAIFPGEVYDVHAEEPQPDRLLVTVRGPAGVALVVRTDSSLDQALPTEAVAGLPWLARLTPRTNRATDLKPRQPVDRSLDDLQRGLELVGVYAADAPPAEYTSSGCLTPLTARVLGLCSYLVGMEVPGLRSLFTRLGLQFHTVDSGDGELAYRVRTIRFDPRFRILDARLEVATLDGVLVATGELRSYVRFSPQVTDLAALARQLDPATRQLAGKVALVCGGSRGLGADVTAALALAGCHVYASSRHESEEGRHLVRRLGDRGAKAELLLGDAGDAGWCRATRDAILQKHQRLDVLVLNACAPPTPLRLGADSAGRFGDYVSHNLCLVHQPLSTFLATLDASQGAVLAVSSAFVEQPPADFAHYVAVKQAVEGTVRAAAREFADCFCLIVRPPRLQTSWNDTPTGVLGAVPAQGAAVCMVNALAKRWQSGRVEVLSEFPAPAEVEVVAEGPPISDPDIQLALAASFTVELLLRGLRFWFRELGWRASVETAGYGQVLQELLNPASLLSGKQRGVSIVLLRVQDWLRELPSDQRASSERLRPYLEATSREFVQAMQAHRQHAAVPTLLVLCPASGEDSALCVGLPTPHGARPIGLQDSGDLRSAVSARSGDLRRARPGIAKSHLDEQQLLDETESKLLADLAGLPGLHVVTARAFHDRYGVAEGQIHDPLRDKIAHIPYQDGYLHTLATLIVRHVHRLLTPPRKVVVVDCDNTLWRGVVGEVGAEGIVFDDEHLALHAVLSRLSQSGVLIGLCTKNDEPDVWQVFDHRPDCGLKRDQIVAAMINWRPKSENLRVLASRLNLGLDSFIFLDDNPVECAEVRAGCPEVLTLQWPTHPQQAWQLLDHTWELDVTQGTKEDQRRTQMYQEEFQRQQLQEQTVSFRDFLDRLELEVDIRLLNAEDLPRASQLTLRTNQFNFTTRRRSEGELQALVAGGQFECRTVRVRDRFGDYGLVGLLVVQPQDERLVVDTFLLSCRVLGRGVEYRMVNEVGKMAAERGLATVRLRVEATKRNAPARDFLAAISLAEYRQRGDAWLECDLPAAYLTELQLAPVESTGPAVAEADRPQGSEASGSRAEQLRLREQQIARTAFELATADALRAAIDGRRQDGRGMAADQSPGLPTADVGAFVYDVFARVLQIPIAKLKEADRLEALGCDSFKIVEITVALIEKLPWLPITLLFEHRSISEIVQRITGLLQSEGGSAAAATVPAPAAVATRAGAPACAEIAVVGMDVRCAGAKSVDELWELLSSGRSAVRPVPSDRPYFLAQFSDTRGHWAGLLDEVDCFDAEFFGVSPREAEFMDPQLRLFLETAWGALEDAGFSRDEDLDVGVYAGVMYGDYRYRANLSARRPGNPYRCWESFSLANRLSQILGVHGPSFAIDTACSSSGTALHLACQALAAGDCRAAIVGGINLILDPDRFLQLGRLGILSPTGKCQPFGAEADGTVLGEGVGVVVLRPLDEARRRGDHIYGVIKGTGLSTGAGTVGFTAPNPQAQAEAIRRSLIASQVDPRTIAYVETHGTGTSLGDPIEVRGLELAYGDTQLWDPQVNGQPRWTLGSIKPNIGHLEAGAGVLGLIKVLLQFERGYLLPSLTSEAPNPSIPFQHLPFDVQRSLQPWERTKLEVNGGPTTWPRRAGLSSFGVGGANAHVILEEAAHEPAEDNSGLDRPCHLLTLTARDPASLQAQAERLKGHLESHPELALGDVCHTANVGRRPFEERRAMIVGSRGQTLSDLAEVAAGNQPVGCVRGTFSGTETTPRVAFLFTGQGAQYLGMGRSLYDTQPMFRQALERCARILDTMLPRPLLDVIFAREDGPDADLLHQTGYTQPALFALQYALSELWGSWGVRPDAVIGHSVGELAALCIAGGVSLEDGLKLVAARGRLMQAQPAGGAMCSVRADETRVRAAIAGYEDRVSIAAINGPQQIVISGNGQSVAEITSRLTEDCVKVTPLKVSHAFHSPLMDPMLAEYESLVRQIAFSAPQIPFTSCVDGALVTEEVTRIDYWLRQARHSVRFAAAIGALAQQGVDAYLEIGPQPVLLGLARACLTDSPALWLPSLRKDAEAWQTMLGSVANLFARGAPIDWKGFDAPYVRRRVRLPHYPFRRQRHWIELPPEDEAVGGAVRARATPADDTDQPSTPRDLLYELVWQPRPRHEGAKRAVERGRWVILADAGGLGRALAQVLESHGERCSIVAADDGFRRAADGSWQVHPGRADEFSQMWQTVASEAVPVRGVVHLWGLDTPPTASLTEEGLERIGETVLGSALLLLQTLVKSPGADGPKIWWVTRNAMAVGAPIDGGPLSLAQSLLWGFGRVVALEHRPLWGGLVDLQAEVSLAEEAAGLAGELLAPDGEDQVAFRRGTRLAPRLRARPDRPTPEVALSGEAVYLVTGGLGALGRRVADWLVCKGARHLLLVSRRGVATPGSAAAIAALEQRGARVEVVPADIAQRGDVARILAAVRTSPLPLRGIIHAGGVDTQVPLAHMTTEDLRGVLAPKVAGGWLLHALTQDIPLDLFICFSSIASLVGSPTRAHYSAANAFLDALTHERRRLGLPALSVNWGPWKGGGMATAEALQQLERVGNRGLEPDMALRGMETLVGGGDGQATVADVDWPRFRAAYEAQGPRALLADLPAVSGQMRPVAAAGPEWVTRLAAVAAKERGTLLLTLLRQEMAQVLGCQSAEAVRPEQGLHELGLDSLLAVDFASRLQRRLGIESSPAIFEHPHLRALAAHLLGHLPAAAPNRITEYDPAVEAEIFRFQTLSYPQRPADAIGPRWRWMFVESAKRLGLAPRVWLYRTAEGVVGHMGAIPVKVQLGGHEQLTAWLVETMVLETFRRQAVGAQLLVQAQQDLPFALSLGQTAEMREILDRLGWQRVAPLETYLLPLHPYRVLEGKLPHASLARAAAIGLQASTATKRTLTAARRASLSVTLIDRFDAPHDALWESVKDRYPCAVVRDASYLNWKYVSQPGQEFIRCELRQRGQLVGIAVLSITEPDAVYHYRRAFLVDLVVDPADRPVLLGALEAVRGIAGQHQADALIFHVIDKRLAAAARKFGFLRREPTRFLVVRPEHELPAVREAVLRPDNWLVTMGDSDIDRPW